MLTDFALLEWSIKMVMLSIAHKYFTENPYLIRNDHEVFKKVSHKVWLDGLVTS